MTEAKRKPALTPRQQALQNYGKKKTLVLSPIYLTDPEQTAQVKSDIAIIADEHSDAKTGILKLIHKEAARIRRKLNT